MPSRGTDATTALRASLLEHARRLVERDGAAALTMRGLAAEAGCAVGLPYKVFADRDELVVELVLEEFTRLRAELDEWVRSAGTGTVGRNLARYARIMLDRRMPAWAMVGSIGGEALRRSADAKAGPSGLIDSFQTTVREYLLAERRLGRVATDVDAEAFGFVITGAVHNLLVAGPRYPRPGLSRVERMLRDIGRRLEP